MKHQDVAWILDKGIDISGSPEFSEFNQLLVVNKKIALPLHSVSSAYSKPSEIEVRDKDGNLLGVLCLCKGMDIDLSTMTDTQMICYLSEIEKEYYGHPYQFQNDYFVLDIDNFEDYDQNYLDTSFLWGGFVHAKHGTKQAYMQLTPLITAIPNIKLPTSYHIETGVRGIIQPFAFERYLKFYHLLELLFDHDTVEKIKGLADDLKGIGHILSTYERNEIDRLKYVVENRCKGYDVIAEKLNGAFVSDEFKKKTKTIFFDFGKEHNPLRNENEEKFDKLVDLGGFTYENAKAVKLADNRKLYETRVLMV
jgi:hypothetical protein